MGGEDGTLVGVIADTHGLLRPEATAALRGCDLIVHAGDVDRRDVLDLLMDVAPVHAVRGNCDHGAWAAALPATEVLEVEQVRLYVIHDLGQLDLDPEAAGIDVVISGHTHRPACERRDGVLYLNPGAAGPRRFDLPICLARLRIRGRDVAVETVDLPAA